MRFTSPEKRWVRESLASVFYTVRHWFAVRHGDSSDTLAAGIQRFVLLEWFPCNKREQIISPARPNLTISRAFQCIAIQIHQPSRNNGNWYEKIFQAHSYIQLAHSMAYLRFESLSNQFKKNSFFWGKGDRWHRHAIEYNIKIYPFGVHRQRCLHWQQYGVGFFLYIGVSSHKCEHKFKLSGRSASQPTQSLPISWY